MIYLDNGSTSFPKPEAVPKAVYEYMSSVGATINRGAYASAYSTEEQVFECRQLLADLFGASDCKNVIFTKNITESLNVVLKGFLWHLRVCSADSGTTLKSRRLHSIKDQG